MVADNKLVLIKSHEYTSSNVVGGNLTKIDTQLNYKFGICRVRQRVGSKFKTQKTAAAEFFAEF